MENTTSINLAMNFLCKRNPFDEIEQRHYVFMLMDFEDKKGGEALEGLAGSYLFAIRNFKGDKQHAAILETFTHDLGERHIPTSLPRSDGYKEIWRDEIKNWQVNIKN